MKFTLKQNQKGFTVKAGLGKRDSDIWLGQNLESKSKTIIITGPNYQPRKFPANDEAITLGQQEIGEIIELHFENRFQAIRLLNAVQEILNGWDGDMRDMIPDLPNKLIS